MTTKNKATAGIFFLIKIQYVCSDMIAYRFKSVSTGILWPNHFLRKLQNISHICMCITALIIEIYCNQRNTTMNIYRMKCTLWCNLLLTSMSIDLWIYWCLLVHVCMRVCVMNKFITDPENPWLSLNRCQLINWATGDLLSRGTSETHLGENWMKRTEHFLKKKRKIFLPWLPIPLGKWLPKSVLPSIDT